MHSDARTLMAFMEALAKNPLDLATRSMFAGWLDDHDEPELADQQRSFDLDRFEAEKRLRKFAGQYAGGDYEGMLQGIRDGRYCFSDTGYMKDIDSQFWEDVSLVASKPITEDDVSFRCAC